MTLYDCCLTNVNIPFLLRVTGCSVVSSLRTLDFGLLIGKDPNRDSFLSFLTYIFELPIFSKSFT